jgi:hypothetical protein
MSEKKRGGAGRGQGRKPKTGGEKLIKRQIFFRPDQLKKMAGQNLSAAIRYQTDFFTSNQISMYALYCHTVFKGYFETYDAAAQAAASMGVTSFDIRKV